MLTLLAIAAYKFFIFFGFVLLTAYLLVKYSTKKMPDEPEEDLTNITVDREYNWRGTHKI